MLWAALQLLCPKVNRKGRQLPGSIHLNQAASSGSSTRRSVGWILPVILIIAAVGAYEARRHELPPGAFCIATYNVKAATDMSVFEAEVNARWIKDSYGVDELRQQRRLFTITKDTHLLVMEQSSFMETDRRRVRVLNGELAGKRFGWIRATFER